jgi:hypothetical protein
VPEALGDVRKAEREERPYPVEDQDGQDLEYRLQRECLVVFAQAERNAQTQGTGVSLRQHEESTVAAEGVVAGDSVWFEEGAEANGTSVTLWR